MADGQSLDVSGLPREHLPEVVRLLGGGFQAEARGGSVTRITRTDG